MKRLPLLAALPLLCASALSAQPLMSVGYFNGGGDVTAGPGGDIDLSLIHISSSRRTTRPSTGVCTRPTESTP